MDHNVRFGPNTFEEENSEMNETQSFAHDV